MRAVDQALMQPRTVTVVGVARDVPGFRITDVKEAGVFLPTSLDVAKTSVVARVQGPPNLARETLLEHLTNVDPNMGNIITMQTVARLETFFLQIAFWVSLILGGLALLLTVSGLFSVLSYLVEQRTREIGVRMALGASSHTVTRLMLAQTTRPVMYGLIAGAGCAAALAAAVLATPAGAYISQIVHVTDPVAYASSLLVIIAACLLAAWIPAARAAKVDPDAHAAAGIVDQAISFSAAVSMRSMSASLLKDRGRDAHAHPRRRGTLRRHVLEADAHAFRVHHPGRLRSTSRVPKEGQLRHVPLTKRLTGALREARHLRGSRVLCDTPADARERAIDIAEESIGETGSFVLVPPRGILEIGLGEWPNDEPAGHSVQWLLSNFFRRRS